MGKYVKKKLKRVPAEAAYIVAVVAVMVITSICQGAKYKKQVRELTDIHNEEMTLLRAELQSDYEAKMTELKQYYEYGGDITQIELEAEYIAKVVYGTARNHADSDKRAVVWCIINRVEHYAHPDTVIEVCEQPKQWMGYSNDNPVLEDLYELSLEELKTWYNNGHRPMNNSYIYLSWSSKEILLRDTFEENKSTNYWRMK